MSRTQYEDSFRTIRGDLYKRIERMPRRRWNSVARPLMDAVNAAFDIVMRIEEDPVNGTKTAPQTRYDRIVEAQKKIKEIEQPLWVYWNICGDHDETEMKSWKESSKANLCEAINKKVLQQLYDMQRGSSKYTQETDMGLMQLQYYTEAEIKGAKFLEVLRDLHRMTHGKVLRLNMISRDADGSPLMKLIDIAFYYAVHGNKQRLNVPSEREERYKSFSKAISALKRAQRYLFNMFSLGSYSNAEMKEWAGLLNDATRLLVAVQKSDSRRTA